MKPSLPLSLAAQLAVLLVVAVFAAQVPATVMFAYGTSSVGQAAFQTRVGDRAVMLARVLRAVPADVAPYVLVGFDDGNYRFSIDPRSAIAEDGRTTDERIYARFLERRFPRGDGPVRTLLGARDASEPSARARPDILKVSVRLGDGRWLNGETYFARRMPFWLRNALAHFLSAVAAILAVVALGLRRIVGPVTALAEVAERAGRGEPVEALPERGPRELRTMTASFNLMHKRLRAYVEDRARMLAAISHDLRTPIASLRLRAEMIEDHELREAMIRTLGGMRQIVEAVLSLARDDACDQNSASIDVSALARAVVEDHRALGRDVTLTGPAVLPFQGRSQVLRRSIDNLIDNAVRYGGCARVNLEERSRSVAIHVDDEGPGVPADRIEEMFAPFSRLESSRSVDTGGMGLGLAIVRSSIRMHGGEVSLCNLGGGGLRAEIVLPKGESHPPKPSEHGVPRASAGACTPPPGESPRIAWPRLTSPRGSQTRRDDLGEPS